MTWTEFALAYLLAGFVIEWMAQHAARRAIRERTEMKWYWDLAAIALWPVVLMAGLLVLMAHLDRITRP